VSHLVCKDCGALVERLEAALLQTYNSHLHIRRRLFVTDPGKVMVMEAAAKYVFRLEAIVKQYYAQHQASGCRCDICAQAELAFASIGHAGPSGPQTAQGN
jgi:hypothetical protein